MRGFRFSALLLGLLATGASAPSAFGQVWVELPRDFTTEGDVVAASRDCQAAAIQLYIPLTATNFNSIDMAHWSRKTGTVSYIDGSLALPDSAATDISEDGKVVVGYVTRFAGTQFSYYWTEDLGLVELTSPGLGGTNRAYACNEDGTVLVGEGAVNSVFDRPYRYERGVGFFDIDTFGGVVGRSTDVSDDGNVVVGYAQDTSLADQAFVWTATTGKVPISLGGRTSFADRISADGKFVVGDAQLDPTLGGTLTAFRYDVDEDQVEALGSLDGSEQSDAMFVSDNGAVVVGESPDLFGNTHGFRWTESTGMVDLGSLFLTNVPNRDSHPTCISANGNVIGGWAQNPTYSGLGLDEREGFLWATDHQIMYISTVLEEAFEQEFPKWRFYEVQALSDDGRRMLIDARAEDDTNVLLYIELPPSVALSQKNFYGTYIAYSSYLSFLYSYYAYIYNQESTSSLYAFLYSYYAYLYDLSAQTVEVDYHNRAESIDSYIAARYTAYQMSYAAALYGSNEYASGLPYTYETWYHAYLAYVYSQYDLELLF